MRLMQGSFSALPDLTDNEIALQVQYALDREWPISVEHTDDPHPRNIYWDMWAQPMFDLVDSAGVLRAVGECRATFPHRYIRITAFDARLGRQTVAMMFLVQRPAHEPGFRLQRSEGADRQQTYSLHAYSSDDAPGQRYRPPQP